MAEFEFSDLECYVVSATDFLILVRGMKQPEVDNGQAASAWSPPAFTAYQKGKLDDYAMYAALTAGGFFVPASEKITYGQTFF